LENVKIALAIAYLVYLWAAGGSTLQAHLFPNWPPDQHFIDTHNNSEKWGRRYR